MILNLLLILFSYLLGSIPTGLLVSKAFAKVDPRQSGSRNIGATNVLRAAGKTLGGITLAGDLLKGLIPVLVALWLRGGEMWIAAVALGAFLGHLFPLYLRFKGGKGVATALGIYIPLVPLAILFNLFVFAAGVAISRTVSVGSLSAAAAMPILIWLWGYPRPYLILGLIVGGLIFYRHRENIKRLLRGQENKIWGRS